MTADRELQEHVLNALDFDPCVDASKIGVTVHDGVVTLRGSVNTYIEKWTAERVTSRVYGVRALANDVDVLPSHDMRRDDSAIAEAAANALRWDVAVPPSVQAAIRNGWVTLVGPVDWRYQRDAAEAAVRRLYGVTGITNMIIVKPRVHSADVRARIESAFKRSAAIDSQRVHVETCDGKVVVLTGTVRSLAERLEAEQAAWSAAGVTMVDDRLAVAP